MMQDMGEVVEKSVPPKLNRTPADSLAVTSASLKFTFVLH